MINVVLDTSALMTHIEQENGFDVVDRYFSDSISGRCVLFASFVSITEIIYTTIQRRGVAVAQQREAAVLGLPIHWIHSDEDLCHQAAVLKAQHRMSFADTFVAATAIRLDALLIHKDPEFLAIGPQLKQHMLPSK